MPKGQTATPFGKILGLVGFLAGGTAAWQHTLEPIPSLIAGLIVASLGVVVGDFIWKVLIVGIALAISIGTFYLRSELTDAVFIGISNAERKERQSTQYPTTPVVDTVPHFIEPQPKTQPIPTLEARPATPTTFEHDSYPIISSAWVHKRLETAMHCDLFFATKGDARAFYKERGTSDITNFIELRAFAKKRFDLGAIVALDGAMTWQIIEALNPQQQNELIEQQRVLLKSVSQALLDGRYHSFFQNTERPGVPIMGDLLLIGTLYEELTMLGRYSGWNERYGHLTPEQSRELYVAKYKEQPDWKDLDRARQNLTVLDYLLKFPERYNATLAER